MSNHFGGRGNLGADPDLKHVEIYGEPRAVAALGIYFDRPVPDGDGAFTDKGGFWLPVNLWGPKAAAIAKLLRKGARVRVEGTLVQDTWDDSETGEPTSRIEVQADSIDLDLARVRDQLPRQGRWRVCRPSPGSCAPPRARAERLSLRGALPRLRFRCTWRLRSVAPWPVYHDRHPLATRACTPGGRPVWWRRSVPCPRNWASSASSWPMPATSSCTSQRHYIHVIPVQ